MFQFGSAGISPEEATNFPPHLAFAKFGFTFLDNIFNEFFLKKTPRNLVDLSNRFGCRCSGINPSLKELLNLRILLWRNPQFYENPACTLFGRKHQEFPVLCFCIDFMSFCFLLFPRGRDLSQYKNMLSFVQIPNNIVVRRQIGFIIFNVFISLPNISLVPPTLFKVMIL